jgi:hypothetical protein
MLVFIDESGDPGFKVERGSSQVFVAAMVIFDDDQAARKTQQALDSCEARRLHPREFKFSKTSDEVRDRFFETARHCPFMVRAIVVQKDRIHSPHLRTDRESFYEFFVKMMLKHDGGRLADARVIIDGSGDRAFRNDLSAAIRKKVRAGAMRDCRFSNSAKDTLIQLADMCAGAIARSFRTDRKDGDRWRNMLRPRLDDVWRFE